MLDFRRELRIPLHPTVLLCASADAVDRLDGPRGLLDRVLDELGDGATVVCPRFEPEAVSLNGREPAIGTGVARAPADDLARRPGFHSTGHPAFGFAACGERAAFLTERTPFHFPFGSSGVLDRLHRVDGSIVLIDLDGRANLCMHLAEVWSNVPYVGRAVRVRAGDGVWTQMRGCPYCSAGFRRADAILRQARVLREGEVRGVRVQAMSVRACVSMAMAMLGGDPQSLLCDDPECAACAHARKMSGALEPADGLRRDE